ncbi:hypothetical protein [Hyphococcus sp.]|uniref:hypothetical protein n=1 Tax=Hyphococcus sp. TaxID=2038636 RepID=UPI003CCC3AEC
MGIKRFWALAGALGGAIGFLLLSGCVTYPYQTAFAACDNEAGACYQYCEQFATNALDYGACHADCEAEVDRCFAQADYDYGYSSTYVTSGYSSGPWYGRYGRWAPRQGYYFDFTYFDRYPSYRRAHPGYRYSDRPWRGRRGDRRRGYNNDGVNNPRRRDRDGSGRRRGGDNDGVERPRRRGNDGAGRSRDRLNEDIGNPRRRGGNLVDGNNPQSTVPGRRSEPRRRNNNNSGSETERRRAAPPVQNRTVPPVRTAPSATPEPAPSQAAPAPRKRTAPPARRNQRRDAGSREPEFTSEPKNDD